MTGQITIQKINKGQPTEVTDEVAIEEPLEIQVTYSSASGFMKKNIAVTMRTPGNDEELAAGFLFTEGIIESNDSIEKVNHIAADENRVLVTLHENIMPVLSNADRNFYSTSSCGICGKASIDAVRILSQQLINDKLIVPAEELYTLQDLARAEQKTFENTGGIHASALFTASGKLLLLREDVGRHNALDKLIGAAMKANLLPLNDHILLLSGRASFELVQKAAMANIRMIAAVGAPSSLAVELANEAGITLVGFLRKERFNIYSGKHRIIL